MDVGQASALTGLPFALLSELPRLWTFLLLMTRYLGLMMLIPGLSGGPTGMMIRVPALVAFAFATLSGSPVVELPAHTGELLLGVGSEILLGGILGLIPRLVVAGVQAAAQLASTTMGLAAGNLIDPTLGVPVTHLGRLLGDLTSVLFLLSGGHYVTLYATAGAGGSFIPGTFLLGDTSVELLALQSSRIFVIGVLVSAPVVVALLLTQLVMGLISKAVSTVNVFVVSFPLTVSIGLVLSVLSVPAIGRFVLNEFTGLEAITAVVLEETTSVEPSDKKTSGIP